MSEQLVQMVQQLVQTPESTLEQTPEQLVQPPEQLVQTPEPTLEQTPEQLVQTPEPILEQSLELTQGPTSLTCIAYKDYCQFCPNPLGDVYERVICISPLIGFITCENCIPIADRAKSDWYKSKSFGRANHLKDRKIKVRRSFGSIEDGWILNKEYPFVSIINEIEYVDCITEKSESLVFDVTSNPDQPILGATSNLEQIDSSPDSSPDSSLNSSYTIKPKITKLCPIDDLLNLNS
jgi:hypothetical protein